MYNKTCFRNKAPRAMAVKVKKVIKRMLGKTVRITFPRELFNGAFHRFSYVRNARHEVSGAFYDEASSIIVNTAVREAETIEEGDVISVHVDNLEEMLPEEAHLGLCLCITYKLEDTGLEYYDECNKDTYVFRKPKSTSRR